MHLYQFHSKCFLTTQFFDDEMILNWQTQRNRTFVWKHKQNSTTQIYL